MHDIFTYPSLAFGADSTPLGSQLQRFPTFASPLIFATEGDSDTTTESDSEKGVPINEAPPQSPPNGGNIVGLKRNTALTILGVSLVALIIYTWQLGTKVDTSRTGYPTP